MEDVIRTAITDALHALGLGDVDFTIEHPENLDFGDYACNVAMIVAKEAKKAPHEVAAQLRAALSGQIEYVEKIEIAGPGFLNFYLARDFFTEEVMRITEQKDAWGKNNLYAEKEILLEYTSPNLFKPLHVGNLVGNIIGESLARLFEYAGATVRRLNYPSDIGLTVAKGVWGLQTTGGNPEDIIALGSAYKVGNEAYETNEASKLEIEAINRLLYAGTDSVLNELRAAGIATSKKRLQELCALLGTTFDFEIHESEASPIGTALVIEHKDDVFEESEGAVVFKAETYGLHTRVFLNSQGLPTYEAKDLGNFSLKQKKYPHWSSSIVVTGGEQTEYFKVVFAAIKKVFAVEDDRELIHIPTGFLTLTTGKMSSRKGNVLTGESVLEELQEESLKKAQESRADDVEALAEMVAVAALKYQILRHGTGTNIVFDKEKALSFEGDSGPYLQYTYARILSVLAKAKNAGIASSFGKTPEAPYALEKVPYRFEEVTSDAILACEPQKVITYLTMLAGMFNAFYAQEKIADNEDQFAPYKVALTEAVAQTLKNGLWVLGIKAPPKM
jgi:arginyl-tRNA synthetase